MSFLRPEARAALWRWREVIAGTAVLALGLWWAATGLSVIRWLAVPVIAAGAAIAWTGLQRLRFRRGGGGAGVVEIVERRIAYWGPLALDPGGKPLHWVLTPHQGEALSIPVNAEGADALFDAFAALPGLPAERMLDLLAHPPGRPVTLWDSGRLRLH